MRGGKLDNRIRFERQSGSDDGYGGVVQTWVPLVDAWASFRPEFGREKLAAGRLESTLRGTVATRRWPATSAITPADRIVFTAGHYAGKTMQIRSIIPTPKGDAIEFAVEEGVAQ